MKNYSLMKMIMSFLITYEELQELQRKIFS